MREIKFRGHDGIGWIYGITIDYDKDTDTYYMLSVEIDEWTMIGNVGQYTGLKHFKNNQEIYEGDVVKGYWWENGKQHRHIGVVTYVNGRFVVRGVKQYKGMDDEINSVYEVIGNKWDNPEMVN